MSKTLNHYSHLEKISTFILDKKHELAGAILEEERFSFHYKKNLDHSKLEDLRLKLIHLYGETIALTNEFTLDKIKNWGKEYASVFAQLGIPLDYAIEEVRFYRDLIGNMIKDEAKKQSLDLDTFYTVISEFDTVVDHAVHMVSLSYMNEYSANLDTAESAMGELSVPVILLGEKVGILPIIGDIDTNRAQLLMDNALNRSVELKLDYLIIDLSGVYIIDTMVAHKIYQVIRSLELVGVETKISGLRPELALTMTSLGVEFNNVKTFSSLHLALKNLGFSRTIV